MGAGGNAASGINAVHFFLFQRLSLALFRQRESLKIDVIEVHYGKCRTQHATAGHKPGIKKIRICCFDVFLS